MRHLSILLVTLLVACVSVSYAEVRNVKISGEITLTGVYRDNYWSYYDNYYGDASESWYTQQVFVNVEAELTDGVGAFIQLANERDWDGIGRGSGNRASDIVSLEQAYIELADMWGYPLTARLGRQNFKVGEGFLTGDYYNWYRRGSESNLSYGKDARRAGDMLRFTYEWEDWTWDLVTVKLEENSNAYDDDRDLYILNANYQWADYGDFDVGLYYLREEWGTEDNVRLWSFSIRGQVEVPDVPGLVVKGEIVPQWGDYDMGNNEDASGIGGYLGVWYWFDNDWKPYIGADYIYMSGDEDDGDDEYEAFVPLAEDETYGVIAETAAYWNWNELSNNGWYEFTNLKIIHLGGGFSLIDYPVSFALDLYDYTIEEIDATSWDDDDLGQEYDLRVTYDYTEDVQLGLCVAWFEPGDAIEEDWGTDDRALEVTGSVRLTF